MNEPDIKKPNRARKIVIWTVIVLLTLPVLFYLFEYVVPSLLPANF